MRVQTYGPPDGVLEVVFVLSVTFRNGEGAASDCRKKVATSVEVNVNRIESEKT